MSARISIKIIMVLFIIISFSAPAGAVPPAPNLSSPPRGATVGSNTVKFQWESIQGCTYHIVVTDMNVGAVVQEESGITNHEISFLLYDSVYSWTVTATDSNGNTGPESTAWLFTVLEEDTAPPDCSITGPNGGEELAGGRYYPITWYTLDDLTPTPDLKISVYYSLNAGVSWNSVADMSSNSGAYRWRVPNSVNSSKCLVKFTATDENGNMGLDVSDAPFTITSTAPLTVYQPHGGESWNRGSSQQITWKSTVKGGKVTIQLLNGNSLVQTISKRMANRGSYTWNIPATLPPGNQYRIKVTHTGAASAPAFSNSSFTLK